MARGVWLHLRCKLQVCKSNTLRKDSRRAITVAIGTVSVAMRQQIDTYVYIYSDHMTYDMYVTSKTNNLITHMSYGFEVDVSIEALRCKCCVLETQGHSVELLAGGSC